MAIDTKHISKNSLRSEFSKMPEKYYVTKLFELEGFTRQKCKMCGKWFWGSERTNDCGDPSHSTYTFFREKPKRIGYAEYWRLFSDFFKKNGHEIVKRYPVVSRWRQDLYFTIAGIQDFQRIENGKMSFEYSHNPLLVPQPCLRFKDIENVGVTGGHFTSFVMANQTSFNYPKEGYWRDRTIELNYSFLTKVMGLDKSDIRYVEDVWAMPDFSEFGPSIEFYSKGAELGNNVFTQFELADNRIRELDGKVVDTGWGLERNLWFYTGLSNAYEASFPDTLRSLEKETGFSIDTGLYSRFARYGGELNVDEIHDIANAEERILKLSKVSRHQYETGIKPAQALYALLDHTRTLLFAITDGSLPSNVGGGYNLRILLRRSFDFIDKYKLDASIPTLAEFIAKELKPMYPELAEKHETFAKVIEVERDRYLRARESAKRAVELLVSKGAEAITKGHVKTLYESNGATPELVSEIAKEKGIRVEIPEGAYTEMVKGDIARKEKEQEKRFVFPKGLPATKQLYYDFESKAYAKVLFAKGRNFVLDKTPFYPEGGGQAADTGMIGGAKVVDVQKAGDIIVHVSEKNCGFKKGQRVEAEVDTARRDAIIAHHTATHLISAAARKVLGEHAWQEGAKKEAHKAHIDVAHYDRLSEGELQAIEGLANKWIFEGIRVHSREMKRGDAESRYGFSIYQGHGVPAKKMRIVTITSGNGELIDAEACGGLHAVSRENLLGMVVILGSSRIHDGIDRIEFAAGPAALKSIESMHSQIDHMAKTLNVEPAALPARVEEMQKELRQMHKASSKENEMLATGIAASIQDQELVERELDVDRKTLIKIADMLVKRNESSTVLLRNREGNIVCMSGMSAKRSAIEFMNSKLRGAKFNGGGSKSFAEAKIEQGQERIG